MFYVKEQLNDALEVSVEINDENEKLLTAFKESNLIDNYEKSPEKEGYYKIIRYKPILKSLPK